MDAGPELDIRVHEAVFGETPRGPVRAYSLDPGAAFSVARKMEDHGFEWGLWFEGTRKDRTTSHLYVVCFGGGGDPKEEKRRQGVSHELPHAICLAALNAMVRTKK